MDQPKEWTIDTHHVRFEPPDILWVTLRGWITEAHAMKLVELAREVGSPRPAYWVVSLEALEDPVEPMPQPRLKVEARQYVAANGCSDWFRAVLYVGGGLLQKITIKGVTVALLLTGRTRFETAFLDNRDAARAWIELYRAKLRAPAGGSSS